jgi:hypothetical protein
VLQSDDDSELPITHAETLARLWPQARLSLREGLGHYRILRERSVVEETVGFLVQS